MTAWTKERIEEINRLLAVNAAFPSDMADAVEEVSRLQSLVKELVEDGGYWLQVSEMLQADVHGVLKIIQSTQYRKHVRLMKKVKGEK